ncbi:Gfo/Idh/MocA family protein [Chryseolinea lacunae]|uniref:Gfo/Idh/MocA family oxidoreductase n=1 Tax=Chryseolinea lacunae TaxID=2801331 RepID=A0ABS1KUE2_9BACT|nr:Gfo/Idh/MocA family oxidoreductase [Chryseolinea lacunae]MBL0742984.1 Gfo/Idh/MocA family oxidoreductase [Chryseolinea lacunae]
MLKIGIIGLGDIARKAYLPVISTRNVEVHLCTRNETQLVETGARYRLNHLHRTVDSLIQSGIAGAFVHTATDSHDALVEQLLMHNIHVYVDKPVSYHYAAAERLTELARTNNLLLHVGFNRRFAPAYQYARELPSPNVITLQKNRRALPGAIRTFIFDDFIHVVDTLLFLFPHPIDKMIVNGKKKDGLLYHVVVQFVATDGTTAIGIMNRDSGTVEERLEIANADEKRVVVNVTDVTAYRDRQETRHVRDDWEPTLHKRGFDQIVDHFLHALESKPPYPPANPDYLLSHKICEQIVEQLERS